MAVRAIRHKAVLPQGAPRRAAVPTGSRTIQPLARAADTKPMSAPRIPAALAGIAAIFALLVCSCSSGSSSAPTAPGPGPSQAGTRFNFSFPATGVSHTYVFPDTGDWNYLCLKHGVDGMRGTVFVRASSLRDSAYVRVGWGGNRVFSPDTVTIRPNGIVRWMNVSTDPEHTATDN